MSLLLAEWASTGSYPHSRSIAADPDGSLGVSKAVVLRGVERWVVHVSPNAVVYNNASLVIQ